MCEYILNLALNNAMFMKWLQLKKLKQSLNAIRFFSATLFTFYNSNDCIHYICNEYLK